MELYEFFKSQGAAIVNDASDFAGTNGCYLYQGRDVKEDKDRCLKAVSYTHLYERIWGYDSEGDSSVVAEHIRRIRSKLAAYTDRIYIETVWGCGYKWVK